MKVLPVISLIWSLFLQRLVFADSSLIPQRLIFTFKTNMLETRHPVDLYLNVKNTIEVYAEAWNTTVEEVDVMFIDDPLCLELIQEVEPRLLEYFKVEHVGAFKADICRVAALHLYGGYYFDVDIEPVKPLFPKPEVNFITSSMPSAMYRPGWKNLLGRARSGRCCRSHFRSAQSLKRFAKPRSQWRAISKSLV